MGQVAIWSRGERREGEDSVRGEGLEGCRPECGVRVGAWINLPLSSPEHQDEPCTSTGTRVTTYQEYWNCGVGCTRQDDK